ncbi:hypothetical protein [Candidatus Binatus sp.]
MTTNGRVVATRPSLFPASPHAGNLFEIISLLQRREGVRFEIKAART